MSKSGPPYPDYQRACGWTEASDLYPTHPRLTDVQTCDAIIIGAGYTGIGIARQLATLLPDSDIRVLEAETVGAGSPGRNSGFVLEHAFTATNPEAAGMLYRQYHTTQQEMREAGYQGAYTPKPQIFKGAATDRGMKNLSALARYLEKSGQPFEWMSADRMRSLTGSRYYRAGLNLPGNSLVNPYTLISNLAQSLPPTIRLYEMSPAVRLSKTSSGWLVTTPEGALQAPMVFLANNAFAASLGVGNAYSVKIFTYAGVSPPLPADLFASIAPEGHWGLLPAHRLGSTLRTTDDGRLLIRGFYGYEHEGNDSTRSYLEQSLFSRFPELRNYGLEKWWGGTTSLTANGAPLWGQLRKGLFASIGCNGVGILKGTLLGHQLANLAAGHPCMDVTGLMGKPGWMPPEPIRHIGFNMVSAVERRLAGDER
ncbi:NAD(P)/FAD-dependent oxidoreductase [Marinobacter salarius]|jgi:glycine/D-amino acid oxidase-like deaminating enzyme|uniref:Gamma-glutamylputrescine oxidoreductase n=1 Tax=Marinobacter salarius TaxID=1420917 RepID=A0A1W6KEC1_9GAMM|nr:MULTISPECIES: FAD-binding oxidoreductase [Marinobacter]ARM85761.1 gamma-glutamylputrescine oxidoreductase [Marinobacter salarius]MBJ7301001.1 FAD-binding oxidoreductase [Marinobacter salarius]HIO30149.1 FAD-binding oxidoreductase [Marinobacter salarius]HIO98418.1 FAD-binding oxidoreductase [Marinobacter salarius]